MNETAKFEPSRFEQGKPMLIAGFSEHYTLDRRAEIPKQWERFGPLIGAVPGQIGRASFGVSSHEESGFDYMTGVHVPDTSNLPAGFGHISVPARRYAVFVHRGPISEFSRTVDGIWHGWLPASGHKVGGPPQMTEVYDEDFDPQTGPVEIWIPIEE